MARRKRTFSEIIPNEEERVINEITTHFAKKNQVFYLIAHPGVGKTSICKKINKNYLIYNVSSFDEEDLVGENATWFKELAQLSNSLGEERCLLVFDDFDKFDLIMHVYISGLLEEEKHIGNYYIPDNVDVLLCGNAEEYSDPLNILDFKLYSKIKKIEFKPGIKDYLHWANKNKVNKVVKSYLNENPTDLIRDIKDKNEYDPMYSLTPKNWSTRVSNEVNISKDKCNLKYYLDDKTIEKFMDYYKEFNRLKIYDILNGKLDGINRFTYNSIDISFVTNALVASSYSTEELENVLVFYDLIKNKEYKDLFMNLWLGINSGEDELNKIKQAYISASKRGDK